MIKVILASHTAAALHNFQKEPVVEMYFTPGIANSIEEKEYCQLISSLVVLVLQKQFQVSVFWTRPFASALQS
jgi:hypothetical protein